jgi:hypothetical protein
MKIKLEGWLYAQPNEYSPANPRISFWDGKETKYWAANGYVPLCAHTIEVEAPDVDVIAGQVQCLLAKREEIVKEFEKATAKIDDAIANLRCLEFNPSEGAS